MSTPDSHHLLAALRRCFEYAPGEDRATGYLYVEGEQDWPAPLAEIGPHLLTEHPAEVVAFQAYRNGTGCPIHVDEPFGDQEILSLGVSRTFQLAADLMTVSDGDVVFVPEGTRHGIVEEDLPGERCSLVFRRRKP